MILVTVKIISIYSTIVALIALFSNLFILVVFFTNRKLRKNGCLYLIVSLTAIDFLTQIAVLPYAVLLYSPIYDCKFYLWLKLKPFYYWFSKIYNYLFYLFSKRTAPLWSICYNIHWHPAGVALHVRHSANNSHCNWTILCHLFSNSFFS